MPGAGRRGRMKGTVTDSGLKKVNGVSVQKRMQENEKPFLVMARSDMR